MNPFFSIITPVYNAEEYLSECIESVIQQSYAEWELILIDDGSSDDSLDICRRYADKDERIIVIHQDNAGAFKARLTGIDRASGQYYVGLDSDDLLSETCLEVLHKTIDETGCDLISYQNATLGADDDISRPLLEPGKRYSGYEFLLQVVNRRSPSPWDKAIRMECVKRADYTDAPENQSISLDSLSIIPAICEVKSVYVIPDALYLYRVREDSICHSYKFIKALDLARVYAYDEAKFIRYDVYTDEIKQALYVDYLRNILTRAVTPYKQHMITRDNLIELKKASFYQNAVEYEKLTFFPISDYRKLWSLRKGIYWLI